MKNSDHVNLKCIMGKDEIDKDYFKYHRCNIVFILFHTVQGHLDVKPLVESLNVLSGDLKEPTHLSIGIAGP